MIIPPTSYPKTYPCTPHLSENWAIAAVLDSNGSVPAVDDDVVLVGPQRWMRISQCCTNLSSLSRDYEEPIGANQNQERDSPWWRQRNRQAIPAQTLQLLYGLRRYTGVTVLDIGSMLTVSSSSNASFAPKQNSLYKAWASRYHVAWWLG